MERPTSLYLMLATYWQRMDELTEAMRRTDETESDTPEYAAAFAAQGECGERLLDAEIEIASFVPTHRYDAKVKASFLTMLADGNNGRLEGDVTAALLSSLPGLVEWRARA